MSVIERVLDHPLGYSLSCLGPIALSPIVKRVMDAVKPPQIHLPPHAEFIVTTLVCLDAMEFYDRVVGGAVMDNSSE